MRKQQLLTRRFERLENWIQFDQLLQDVNGEEARAEAQQEYLPRGVVVSENSENQAGTEPQCQDELQPARPRSLLLRLVVELRLWFHGATDSNFDYLRLRSVIAQNLPIRPCRMLRLISS